MSKQVKLSDIKMIPLTDSVKRIDMSDERYFSEEFSNYVSNSGLKYINPEQGGSLKEYFAGNHHFTSSSLILGSAIHEAVLQPESFRIAPKCNKPTAKLGLVADNIKKYRKLGYSIYDSIKQAATDADYYGGDIDKKIRDIIQKCLPYYLKTRKYDDGIITLDDKMYDTAETCIANLNADKTIMNKLHPTDLFGDPLPSFNEDALFMNYLFVYKNEFSCILKYKMKADNWTIDVDNKILTLNDLKTSGHAAKYFMYYKDDTDKGSYYNFHYGRQAGAYLGPLTAYCQNEYGYDPNTWETKMNFLVVSTVPPNDTRAWSLTPKQIENGKREFEKCMKMVAYGQMFGCEEDIEFV